MHSCFTLLLAVCAATALDSSAQIKAYDTATPSYIEFSAPRFEVNGAETNAIITLVRTGDYRTTVSIDYATKEGTATANVDFKPCGGTVVFSAGQSFKTINIPIVREEAAPAKTFAVELGQPKSSYVVVTQPSAEVEIQAAAPSLAMELADGSLVVSWPDVGLPFYLESFLNGAWNKVETAPSLTSTTWTVSLNTRSQVEFFRLTLDASN